MNCDHIDSVAPPGGQREAFEADMLRTYWNHVTKSQDYASVAVQAMWQARCGNGYPSFVELLEPTAAERTIRDALAVNCRFYAASGAWSYDTQAWQAATYPGHVDALVRTIDGLRASLAPIHARVEDVAPSDPMDWPLPCDVTVGHGTMRKGVKLGTLVTRMKALYEMATGENADAVAARKPEQGRVLLDEFLAAAADAGVTHLSAQQAAQPVAGEPEIRWPKENDVGRMEDMSTHGFLRVGLDESGDAYVHVFDGKNSADVEFCAPGSGGGRSSRTRLALVALMVAMEADNAERPDLDWWAIRNGGKSGKDGAA